MEKAMETLGPFKGVYREYTGLRDKSCFNRRGPSVARDLLSLQGSRLPPQVPVIAHRTAELFEASLHDFDTPSDQDQSSAAHAAAAAAGPTTSPTTSTLPTSTPPATATRMTAAADTTRSAFHDTRAHNLSSFPSVTTLQGPVPSYIMVIFRGAWDGGGVLQGGGD